MKKYLLSTAMIAVLGALPVSAENHIMDYKPVTQERLLDPESSDWLSLRRTLDGHGHSPLDEINKQNVTQLETVWNQSTGPYQQYAEFAALPARPAHQAPALVNDGVMFMVTPDLQIIALDAVTGEEYWRYVYEFPADIIPVHPTNKGVALWEDKIYMNTQDAHTIAVDAKTGELVWKTKLEDYRNGYYNTAAPLVVDGVVVVGTSGGEFGIRGFLQGLDAESGITKWKTYTIPHPDAPGGDTWPGDTWKTGGGSTWITGNYDKENDLVVWGVGNAAPWIGDMRPGDNLYTTSSVAVSPQTGEIKSHFQYHHNGNWDWDEVFPPTLMNLDGQDLAVRFARNGYIYKMDRSEGDFKFIEGKPYVHNDAFLGLDPETGRPEYDPDKVPGTGKYAAYCPSAWGGRDWLADSYNAKTGILYIPVNENMCGEAEGAVVDYEPGVLYLGSGLSMKLTPEAEDHIGAIQAWDIRTLEKKWQVNFKSHMWGATMSTDGGLVFAGGTSDGMFRAFDADSGEILWEKQLDGGINTPPTTFTVDGKQYVAVTTGWGVDADRVQFFIDLNRGTKTEIPQGGSIWVFALPS